MPKPEENSLNLGPHQFIPSLLGNLLPPRPESSDPCSLSYLSLLWAGSCMHCQSTPPFWGDSLFAAPWTVAHQAPLSVEFSGQEYWSG